MGNQMTSQKNSSQNRFRNFKEPRGRNPSINNLESLVRSKNMSTSQANIRRYKSVDGFSEAFNQQNMHSYNLERNKRKVEKHTNVEITEAIDFSKHVVFSLSLNKVNNTINMPSLTVDTDSNASQICANRFSKSRSVELKPLSHCKDYELDYLIERINQKKEKPVHRPIKPPVPQRKINIDLLEGSMTNKQSKKPLGFFNDIKGNNETTDFNQNRINTKTLSSPESNKPFAFQIKPNQVFSFHQNLPVNQINSSSKKKQPEQQRVIEENSYDDSIELSRSELFDQPNDIATRNSKSRKDHIASISNYLMDHEEPVSRQSLSHKANFNFIKPVKPKEETKLGLYEEDQMEDTIKRDSFPQKGSIRKFESPRKLNIDKFKSSQDMKNPLNHSEKEDARINQFEKPRVEPKPKEIKVDLTTLTKNSTKSKFMKAFNQNASTKKSLRDHLLKNKMQTKTNFKDPSETKPSNIFANEEERSIPSRPVQPPNNGVSYGLLHARKKSLNAVGANKPVMDRKKSFAGGEKEPMRLFIEKQPAERPRPYNQFKTTSNAKMALDTLHSPKMELSNNIIQKFRQSAKKKNSSNQFFATQGPSIRQDHTESEMFEEESIEASGLNQILNQLNKGSSAKKNPRLSIGVNNPQQEDSVYNKLMKTTQSSCNNSKQNIKVDINSLSSKMKLNFDQQFMFTSQKKFGR